jgi:hypothetical protein
MFKNIHVKIAALFSVVGLLVAPVGVVAIASAATPAATTNLQKCLAQGTNLDLSTSDTNGNCNGTSDTSGGTSGINKIITDVINIFSLVVGIVAVIMIIVGGFRYITSGGASDSVSGAKNTIIYAIIGLIVVALAQFIVQFVLNKVTQ